MEYDYQKNPELKDALEWAEWLSKVKDPGIALLAAKKHSTVLAQAYYEMSSDLNAWDNGSV